MRARVPGSTSNLGPGFDVLGLALGLYVDVEVSPAAHLEIVASGEGAGLPRDADHLAARVAREVLGHDRCRIEVHSQIPVGRGLGSSAALAAATAAAAGAINPLAVAAAFDGHAENAAASVLGGLVGATLVDGEPVANRLALDPELTFVLVVPERNLETRAARAALPAQVEFGDAVFNLGRLGLLLAGLADHRVLSGAAGEDRLHQAARTPLFPESSVILAALRDAGAVVATWSGAGPTMLGICVGRAACASVLDAGRAVLTRTGVAGLVLELRPDLEGLVLS